MTFGPSQVCWVALFCFAAGVAIGSILAEIINRDE